MRPACVHHRNQSEVETAWGVAAERNLAVTMCECCLGPSTLLESGPQHHGLGFSLLLRPRCKFCRLDENPELVAEARAEVGAAP